MRCSAWKLSERYRKETAFVVSNNDQGLKFNHTDQSVSEIRHDFPQFDFFWLFDNCTWLIILVAFTLDRTRFTSSEN